MMRYDALWRMFHSYPIIRLLTLSYALTLANISLQVRGLGGVELSLARQSDSVRSWLQAGETMVRECAREEGSSGRGRRREGGSGMGAPA